MWCGANVTIMKGVTIGRGSIVAAGAVVTKSCSPYSIIGGVPAKFIKRSSLKSRLESTKEYYIAVNIMSETTANNKRIVKIQCFFM